MKSPWFFIIISRGCLAWTPLFKHWSCVGLVKNVVEGRPYVFQVGDLPMVLWKKPQGGYVSTINICNHMGSTLSDGCITAEGGLQCQYHGMEVKDDSYVGKIIEQEDKLFWSFGSQDLPHQVPHYYDADYETQCFEYDMPCSLPDAAFNSMDLHHPEFVHNNLFGFGSIIPPTNIQTHLFEDDHSVGLSFDYVSGGITSAAAAKKKTRNYHEYHYPTFTWSRVAFDDAYGKENRLIVAVHFLPVGPKQTKWFVTVAQYYLKAPWHKPLVYTMAMSILNQDRDQMEKQALETELKKDWMFLRAFSDEKVLMKMRPWFDIEYKYPDQTECRKLVQEIKSKFLDSLR